VHSHNARWTVLPVEAFHQIGETIGVPGLPNVLMRLSLLAKHTRRGPSTAISGKRISQRTNEVDSIAWRRPYGNLVTMVREANGSYVLPTAQRT
jgi:hypothetical protein